MDSNIDRRSFLAQGVSLGGGSLLAGSLQAFLARPGHAKDAGYGPLAPVKDQRTGVELLALPRGFAYWSFGEVGSPMSDGRPTPAAHDGMAAFQFEQKIHLVRNHEVRGSGIAFGPAAQTYDPRAGGGTTTIIFDPNHPSSVSSFASLSGTSTNCAGGRTPRNSWLSCEETLDALDRPHGFVFEVPVDGTGVSDALPLTALGRFVHEAVAVDPSSWNVYLTEDALPCGLYRFVPRSPGVLTSGQLQMLAISGQPQANLSAGQIVGTVLAVSWVDIDVPVPNPVTPMTSVFAQGRAKGGAAFRRLEGACYSAGDGFIYFNSTDGGEAAAGQVWALKPGRDRDDVLSLVYQSPSTDVLLKPDNITLSPGGGVLLCEDPDRVRQAFLRGLTLDGKLYDFAANVRPGMIPGSNTPQSFDEFAGATFTPDGKWLFVNIQTPGITFAITGPFEKGPLSSTQAR